MSNVADINAKKQNSLVRKVEAKLDALQSFLEGAESVFEIPDKFTYNWFVSLSEGSLEPFSKASKSVKTGTALRKRIDEALHDCEAKRLNDQLVSKGNQPKIAELKRQKQSLVAENKHLKQMLDTKIDENIELRRQLLDAQRQLGISQAVWADQKQAKNKVTRVKFQ